MSGQSFLKILCIHCAGRIEFPAEYAGQTIPCPHCQKPVQLKTPPVSASTDPVIPDYPDPATLTPEDVAKGHKAKWHIIYAVGLLVGVNLVLGAAYFFRSKPNGPLEGIQIANWKLEAGEYKTFYITGTLSNSTGKAIPKARVEFFTLDDSGATNGTASAIITNLAANGSQDFSIQTPSAQPAWDAKPKGVFAEKE